MIWGVVSLPPGLCSCSVCSPVRWLYNWQAHFSLSMGQLFLQRTHSRLWSLWSDCWDSGQSLSSQEWQRHTRRKWHIFYTPKLPPRGHWPMFFFCEMIVEILLVSPGSLIPKGINATLGEGKQCLPTALPTNPPIFFTPHPRGTRRADISLISSVFAFCPCNKDSPSVPLP